MFGGGHVRVLARSSALSNTLASLTHSKKFEPSELRGANINACILDSVKLGFVDIDILVCILAIGKIKVYFDKIKVHLDWGLHMVNCYQSEPYTEVIRNFEGKNRY
jgi:hypothetical protein